ncbi:MAG: hydrogenobyrinic acid a,c-diamide synthase (glutamine-hydrolyzing) [Nitrospirae bacterium]|nr:hydrogenobyrinic acid a,c-diamide synthase (glutamine-hydrolyzing) [Nitrospirota bacterium]
MNQPYTRTVYGQSGSCLTAPRVVISAAHGRSGKTTVSIGLCAALAKRGLKVQPFKKGPDYIDPSWLTAAAGSYCRNLDLFMMGQDGVKKTFVTASRSADINIIEGNKGLYDSVDIDGENSTANISRILKSPVILIVDSARMTRSIAALVNGYKNFEPDINIVGVILNNVSGSRHEAKLRAALERYCKIDVLGCLPRSSQLNIPERHLGLIPQKEDSELMPAIENIRKIVETNVNIDRIIEIAKNAPQELRVASCEFKVLNPKPETRNPKLKPEVRIGVPLDKAFSFYYLENLDALRDAGAEIVFFDTLEDKKLPDVDGLYIGGGFPEMFMDELEANASLRRDIHVAIEAGMPVYAECGGLMYLSRSISWDGKIKKMVGVLPCDIEMTKRVQAHGYVVLQDADGREIKGHEFHYSRFRNLGDVKFLYKVIRGKGIDGKNDGIIYKNVIASYAHLHAIGSSQWAEEFVELIGEARGEKQRYRVAV